jgi:Ser/Thr protein kinase RdoA (MazF antagonist)
LKEHAARAFQLAGAVREIARFGSGHIHDTYAVRCVSPAGAVRYVLQRLNAAVFPDPELVVANVVRVSDHVRTRLARRPPDAPPRRALDWCSAGDGRFFHRDADGGVWRACALVEHTHTRDAAASPAEAAAVALAFGEFLGWVADLDAGVLRTALPGYGDLAGYARSFEAAVAADAHGRLAGCRAEVDAARAAWERLADAREAARALPLRVVHADCKINNVLLDDVTGAGVCVIDLDTVMAGRAPDDFGRLVRSATCFAEEDERDLSRVGFELPLFEALCAGFLAGAGDRLSRAELEALPAAGPLSALEHVLRFLADHLEGDRYFRARRPGQNLDRARMQARLLEAMEAKAREARACVRAAAR